MEPDITPLESAPDSPTTTTFKKHFCTVTPLSKYLAMVVVIMLPFIGGYVGYHYAPEKVVEVERAALQEIKEQSEAQHKLGDEEVITPDLSGAIQAADLVFNYLPSGISVVQTPTLTTSELNHTEFVSINITEIPGYFVVTTLSYEELAARPLFTGTSCCSGTRYNYNQQTNTWSAYEFEGAGSAEGETRTPLALGSEQCSLAQSYGNNTFYKIRTTDEGVTGKYHYFLFTNQDQIIELTTPDDIHFGEDFDKAPSGWHEEAQKILAGISLPVGTQARTANCDDANTETLIEIDTVMQEFEPVSPTDTKDFSGTWFRVSYPADFTAMSDSNNDGATFASSDGLVEFYVYSPMWYGDTSYTELKSNEEVVSDESVTEQTVINPSVTNTTITRRATYRAKDGSYLRSFVSIKDQVFDTPDQYGRDAVLHHVFGIKYKHQAAYNKYLSQYLDFKKSLMQFAD